MDDWSMHVYFEDWMEIDAWITSGLAALAYFQRSNTSICYNWK